MFRTITLKKAYLKIAKLEQEVKITKKLHLVDKKMLKTSKINF